MTRVLVEGEVVAHPVVQKIHLRKPVVLWINTNKFLRIQPSLSRKYLVGVEILL